MQLKASFAPGLPSVYADLGLIERVLANLLDNALRHTPAGGDVEITLAAKGDSVEVTLSDSGPGIAPELREGLFLRPFNIGGARRDGGLGLRIVHRILELQGCEIRLVDRAGRGATFCFALPRDAQAAAMLKARTP
ncbi:Adaptive-response sensory-kinase SasA [compost metagenome]